MTRLLRSIFPEYHLSARVPQVGILVVLLLSAWIAPRASTRFLILTLGGFGALLLLKFPGIGLVALAGLSFTLPLSVGTGSDVLLTPPVFIIPVVALVWIVNGLWNHSIRLPSSRTILPLMLFVGSGLYSLMAGRVYWDVSVPQPDNLLLVQLGQWGIYALSAVVFILAGEMGVRGRWLMISTVVFLIAGCIVVLEFFLTPVKSVFGWSVPTMANRSMFWVWLAAMASGQMVFNRQLDVKVKGAVALLLMGATFVVWFKLNDWISGWAPFSVTILTVGWFYVHRRNRTLGILVAVVVVVLLLVIFPYLFEHAGGEKELDVSWGGRQTLYRATLDLIKDHPLLGLGPAAYRHYGHTRWLGGNLGSALWLRPNISSHNNYIDIYAQMGLVGLALFFWFLVEMGLLVWRLIPLVQNNFDAGYVFGAIGGCVGTLAAMLLADWFLPFVYNIGFVGFRTSALAWMFLGGLLAMEQRYCKDGSGNMVESEYV
jgi:hypothetical protein